jgi:transcriptional regulator with XRE-family HTH domain
VPAIVCLVRLTASRRSKTEGRFALQFCTAIQYISIMSSDVQIDEMVVPDPKGLGAYVRLQREMLHWKQATLAAMAGISVTTVERIERGETVRPANLEKIAVAFEMEPDIFTRPRRLLSEEEAVANLTKSLDFLNHKKPVAVAPFRTEVQLRALATTHFVVLDTDLDDEAHGDLASLREWIDLAAFMKPDPSGLFWRKPDREYRVRRLYGDVFDHVDEMERRHNAVCLVGTYDAECEDPTYGLVPIGLLCLRSKRRNPAAALLDQVWVEKRMSLHRASAEDPS